jgi:hypothetical protein
MRFALTVIVTNDDIGAVTAQLANRFGEVNVQALAYHQGTEDVGDEDDLIDDDDVSADDVLAVLEQRVRTAGTPEAAVQAMVEARSKLATDSRYQPVITTMIEMAEQSATEADPTPPHGIERPRILRKPGWPENYWINKEITPTQGSGDRVRGLERVPCAACGAPVDEVCITDRHGPYRWGFGHTSRRLAFKQR